MGGKERKCYDCSLPCYRDDVENESIYHSSDADTSENKSFFQYSFIPALFLLVIGTVSVIHYWIVETSECWGAPYLLVTHHDGNNVLKFSRNGCLITHAALAKKDTGQGHLREAVIGSYKGEEALYVANTGMRNPKKGLSELLVYGGCSTLTRKRHLVRKITDNSQITLAKHPYGITFDDENNVYASFQHSDAVLRFEHDTFKPMYSPASLHTTINGPDDEANDHSYLPRKTGEKVENNGLFFSMRKDTKVTSTHFKKEEGVRGLAFVQGELWVANEDDWKLYVLALDGNAQASVDIVNPIALHVLTAGSAPIPKDKEVTEESPAPMPMRRTQSTSNETEPDAFVLSADDYASGSIILVSSKESNGKGKGGNVYAVHAPTREILFMFPVKETLQRHWKKARKKAFRAHPAGLSTHEGILYVAEQGTNSVLAFDIATQTFLHTVIGPNNFLSTVESIELSQC